MHRYRCRKQILKSIVQSRYMKNLYMKNRRCRKSSLLIQRSSLFMQKISLRCIQNQHYLMKSHRIIMWRSNTAIMAHRRKFILRQSRIMIHSRYRAKQCINQMRQSIRQNFSRLLLWKKPLHSLRRIRNLLRRRLRVESRISRKKSRRKMKRSKRNIIIRR